MTFVHMIWKLMSLNTDAEIVKHSSWKSLRKSQEKSHRRKVFKAEVIAGQYSFNHIDKGIKCLPPGKYKHWMAQNHARKYYFS